MKANEAPEKIYVHKSQYWGLMANEHNTTENDIEYTRTDAFIEKACKWIIDNFPTVSGISALMYADDFKKAMKL